VTLSDHQGAVIVVSSAASSTADYSVTLTR